MHPLRVCDRALGSTLVSASRRMRSVILRQELFASSARLNGRTKNIRIHPIVVSKFKLVDVQMQVFLADLVERADDPTLHDGPEPLDGVGMNGATPYSPSA